MLPDKIVIMDGEIHRTEKTYINDIEYIRKDALLEWAKERYKHYQQHAEDAVCWGQRNAFQQLIDKLNSI